MKVVRGTVLAVVFAVMALRCGGNVASTASSDGDASQCLAWPPPDPHGTPAAPGDTVAFAIRKLYLGVADRSGARQSDAWRGLGYDLDGRATTRDSPGPCVLASGAARSTQIDGDCGIDNSFGENLLPIILTAAGPDLTQAIEPSIAAGGFTDLVVGVANGAITPTAFVNGAALGHPAAWDGSDAWPVDSTQFAGGAAGITFARGYASGDLSVGAPRSGRGWITLGTYRGTPVRVPVDRVLVTMRIAPDASRATDGVLSGVVPTEALIQSLSQHMGGAFSAALCGAGKFGSSVVDQIRDASDTLADGADDPSRPCDAISFGLGFEASAVRLGPRVEVPRPPDWCASDAGTD